MKRMSLLVLLVLFAFVSAKAASVKDIFTANDMVWLGLDFSHIRLIGSDFNDINKIKQVFFKDWNDLTLKEASKYNIAKFFQKGNVVNDLSIVEKTNNVVKESTLQSDKPLAIDKSMIQKAIKDYNFGKNKGIGLMLFMECFNKTTEKGVMWVTFIDLDSKTVLMAEKMEGTPGGFGFRNYWAKTYYNVLKDCQKKYSEWKTQYGS